MNMISPELKKRIAKIYELAKRGGTEGEKLAAQKALDKLIEKYNLEGLDLEAIDKERYAFKYKSTLELGLIERIITILIEDDQALKSACRRTRGVKQVEVNLTYLDFVTVSASYEYFRRHMKTQWDKVCAPELKRCRKTKTRNQRRKELQGVFFSKYVIASRLYKEGELSEVKFEDLSQKELKDRAAMRSVSGGAYNRQMSTGLLLEADNT